MKGEKRSAESKRLETVLPENQDVSRIALKALSSSEDGIAIGCDGQVIYCNKSWIKIHRWPKGYDPAGKHILDIEREELKPIVYRVLESLQAKGHYTGTFEVISPQGDLRHFHLKVDRLKLGQSFVEMAILREITELINVKKDLEAKNTRLYVLNEIGRTAMEASDLRTVARKMLDVLGKLICADAGGIYKHIQETNDFILIDSFGIPRQILKNIRIIPASDFALATVLSSRRSVILEEDMPGFCGGAKDIRSSLGFKRVLGVSLRSSTGSRYIMLLAREKEENIELPLRKFLESSAIQFGTALDRIELLERLENGEKEIAQREKLLEAMAKIHNCTISSESSKVVLKGMLRVICDYLAADCACILSMGKAVGRPEFLEHVGRACYVDNIVRGLDIGSTGNKKFRKLSRVQRAFVLEEEFPGLMRGKSRNKGLARINRTLGIAILGSEEENYYLLAGFAKGKVIDNNKKRFLEMCGKHFSLAIERLGNIARFKEREMQLRMLSARLVEVDENMRRICALHLHDDVNQELVALGMEISQLERVSWQNEGARELVESMRSKVVEISRSVRDLSRSLYSPVLEDLGLFEALYWYVQEWKNSTGIDARFLISCSRRRLPKKLENALYRIVQECLENVRRHSHASKVEIRLTRSRGSAILTVSDNGKGISTKVTKESPQGLGLLSISERALSLGGSCRIESSPGRGAKIHVNIPIGD